MLGELLAQEIEAAGGGKVERRFWLAGSYLCQQALVSGRIDGYVEYTGTALTAVLKQPLERDAAKVHETVGRLYEQRYEVREGPGLGFEDTFAMVVRGDDARKYGLKTISDVVKLPSLRLGVGYEFAERPDGLPGLAAAYGGCVLQDPRERWSWDCCTDLWRRDRWTSLQGTRPTAQSRRLTSLRSRTT